MKKFIITEEERKHIKSLYEQTIPQPAQQQPTQPAQQPTGAPKVRTRYHYSVCETKIGQKGDTQTNTPYNVCSSRDDDGTFQVSVSDKSKGYLLAKSSGKDYDEALANITKEVKTKLGLEVGKDVPLPKRLFD